MNILRREAGPPPAAKGEKFRRLWCGALGGCSAEGPEPGCAADAAGVSVDVADDGRGGAAAEGVVGKDFGDFAVVEAVEVGEASADDDDVGVEDVGDDGEASADAREEAMHGGGGGGVAGFGGFDDFCAAESAAVDAGV